MKEYSGLDYLRIDIANQMAIQNDKGITLDKCDFEERLAWVNQYEDNLEDLVNIADKPFQYLAAVMAYRDAQNGVPIGHLVELDAGASGLQLMACLTGCETTAHNTGLLGGHISDVYQVCKEEMELLLGEEIDIPRKPVKQAMMTRYYGSKNKPKQVFGDGTPEYYAFYKANETVAPGACELLDILISSWQPYALDHHWVMPDGFNVHVPVMEYIEPKIEVDELD